MNLTLRPVSADISSLVKPLLPSFAPFDYDKEEIVGCITIQETLTGDFALTGLTGISIIGRLQDVFLSFFSKDVSGIFFPDSMRRIIAYSIKAPDEKI